MALKQIKPGRSKEKRGAARRMVMRSRPQGDPVPSTLAVADDDGIRTGATDDRLYVETEYDTNGNLVTNPATIPRP